VTSLIGDDLLAKAYITQLNKFAESEVTELTSLTVDDTDVDNLKSKESGGITIVSSQRKIIFDIQANP
jgi:hypothetical protein